MVKIYKQRTRKRNQLGIEAGKTPAERIDNLEREP